MWKAGLEESTLQRCETYIISSLACHRGLVDDDEMIGRVKPTQHRASTPPFCPLESLVVSRSHASQEFLGSCRYDYTKSPRRDEEQFDRAHNVPLFSADGTEKYFSIMLWVVPRKVRISAVDSLAPWGGDEDLLLLFIADHNLCLQVLDAISANKLDCDVVVA